MQIPPVTWNNDRVWSSQRQDVEIVEDRLCRRWSVKRQANLVLESALRQSCRIALIKFPIAECKTSLLHRGIVVQFLQDLTDYFLAMIKWR